MDFVKIKQENMFVWPCRWTVLLSVLLMWLPQHHCMITSDEICAGQQLSLTCTEGWLIHIIYETYSYSTTPCTSDLDPGTVTCTKAEFLAPLSVGHCNGKGSCMFTVSTNTTISSCNKTATALSVHYKCISEASVFTICSDVTFQQTEQLYLATPDFPSNILGQQKNCSCTLIGENINGTVLQHTRDPDSSVIMSLSTNRGTQHINRRNILNTIIFSNLTKINLFLENQLEEQVYKIWLGFKGNGMSLKCQYERPEPETSPTGVSVNPTMSLVTNETKGDIILSTEQSKVNRTISLVQNISVTPTQTFSSQSNTINCSETKNSKNLKCNSDNVAFGISSSLSEVPSTWDWIRELDTMVPMDVDLSTHIESSIQEMIATKGTSEVPTKSLIFTKLESPTKTVIPFSDTTHIQSSMRNIIGTSIPENSGMSSVTSSRTENSGTFTETENSGISSETQTLGTSSGTENSGISSETQTLGTSSRTENSGISIETQTFRTSSGTENSGISIETQTFGTSSGTENSGISSETETLGTSSGTENSGISIETQTFRTSSGTENSGISIETQTFGTSSGTENSGISSETETLGTSSGTENSGISTETETLGTSSGTSTGMDQKLGTNTPTIEMPSSVTSNTNQTNPGLPLKTADQDVALLIIVSCLAFVLLVAMVIFIVIMWRRANVNQHTQEETHIYDAYHHDNGSLGPDPLGEDHSYYAPANGSILT